MAARRAALVALLALGAGSLAFDLTLPLRLPSDQDWAEAAGALRAAARPGDAVQIWPAWAERARLFVDAMPVLAEEDLQAFDDPAVRRLWVLALPRTPFFHDPAPALQARGATAVGDERRFGALSLRPWDLHAPELAADLTKGSEEHEVDYVARRCVQVPIGGRFSARGAAGTTLHLRAGVIGERAYDANRPAIEVRAFADGALIGNLAVPRTARDGTGWRRLDVAVPAGAAQRDFL
ncbi:MAG: hypothetical protein ACM3PC_08440, partial [Deltaproteobacteria bacterium]